MADVIALPTAARRKIRQARLPPPAHPAFAQEPPIPEEIMASIRFLACYSEQADRHFGYIRDHFEKITRASPRVRG